MIEKKFSADEISHLLGLEPLPLEGGLYTQTLKKAESTAIYYLLSDGDFSAMHRLKSVEIYHHYAGAPVKMLLLHPDGQISEPLLGSNFSKGERPQLIVEEGVWQGSSTLGSWSLMGTTMSPPYEDEMFELAKREELLNKWTKATRRIHELTRV